MRFSSPIGTRQDTMTFSSPMRVPSKNTMSSSAGFSRSSLLPDQWQATGTAQRCSSSPCLTHNGGSLPPVASPDGAASRHRDINFNDIREMRQSINPLAARLSSRANARGALGESGSEWKSAQSMRLAKRMHIRSDLSPVQKYPEAALASQNIGWHVDRGDVSPKRSLVGLKECPMQKWKIDLTEKKVIL
ncbi:unnamed protein product [Prorocentrum cordatum]|uniref:Uncharacterized protein n=1 Tax=Prorocentrum cordatum TaxID=2364126 RepID=A0ABN9RZD5_9DINO|nr:unnamed protein product [Polarella glacialis]